MRYMYLVVFEGIWGHSVHFSQSDLLLEKDYLLARNTIWASRKPVTLVIWDIFDFIVSSVFGGHSVRLSQYGMQLKNGWP